MCLNDHIVHCLVFSDWHILQIHPDQLSNNVSNLPEGSGFLHPKKLRWNLKNHGEKGNHLNQTFIFWFPAVTLQEVSVQALEFHPVFPVALPQVATVAFGGSHLERTVSCVFLGCEARVFVGRIFWAKTHGRSPAPVDM